MQQMAADRSKQEAEAQKGAQYITSPAQLDNLQYQYWAGADTNNFNTGYSVNFQLDGKDYTFIPTDVINKGFTDGNTQYFIPDLLKKDSINTLKTKGQAIDLNGVGWYGDFLKNTLGRNTTGILIPAEEAPKLTSTINNYEIGSKGNKNIPQNKIAGLAQTKNGDFVYQNETPKGNYPGMSVGYATQYIQPDGSVKTISKDPPPKAKYGGIVGDIAKVANVVAPIALALVPGVGPVLSAAYSAGNVIGRGGSIEDAFKAGATSYVAGQVAGTVAKPVAGVTDSAIAASAAGGAAAGGTSALIRGDSVAEGLLTGAAGGAIAGGVSAAVDAGTGLFEGNKTETIADAGADNTLAEAGAETKGTTMDDYELTTYINELGDDYTFGDQEGDYDMEGSYGDPLAPGVKDAVETFFDTNVKAGLNTEDIITKAAKRFGTNIVKSFLGIGGAKGVSTTVRTALRKAGFSDTDIDKLGPNAPTFLESVLGGGAGLFLSEQQRKEVLDAYNTASSRVSAAGREAADLSKFTPFGTKSAFGESKFTYDPTTGKLTGAEYTASPEVAAERDRLFKLASGITPTATSMGEYEQSYLANQRGLLQPERDRQLAATQERLARTGRSGFGVGQGAGMMATNPELAAYYNSLATQERELAANAPTYARSLFSTDITNLGKLYGQANVLEGYAAAPLTTSLDIAGKTAQAGATQGRFITDAEKAAAELTAKGNLLSASSKTEAYNELRNLAGAAGKTIDEYISEWMINNP